MKRNNSIVNTKKIVVLAMFCAIAYITCFILRISGIGGFLSFEIKDTVITIAAMLFGPLAGVAISFTVAFLEMISFSSTGIWGAIMNFASSAVFSVCASTVYIYCPGIKKKISGAIVGLATAIISMTAVMMVLNLIITPIYQNVSVEVVKGMLLPLLLPFNAIKATLNSALIMMLYKPISMALKRAKVVGIDTSDDELAAVNVYHMGKKSILILIVAAIVAIACLVLLMVVLGGEISWIRDMSK
ncbi:MAG: ECF transporter S component [Clostridia bacterium]|nr:ECF transporter S component [Clostridia bacterium]